MHYYLYLLLLVGVLGGGITQDAAAQFSLSAEIRPRAEYRDGFKKPLGKGVDPAFFIEQRTRFNTSFSSDKIQAFISFQDVRNWGSTAQIYKSDPSLNNLYAAWASYSFHTKHAVAVGRMELDYDNARILGNLDWAAQGRSHDLLKYEFKGEKSTFHAGLAFNQDYTTPEPVKFSGTYYGVLNNYKSMQFAWYQKTWEKATVSLLAINNGASGSKVVNGITVADSSVYFSQTVGLYGTKKFGSTALEYDAYYQLGKSPSGKDLRAWMVAANITFLRTKPTNFSFGIEYLTGDNSATANQDEAFNPLYGTHHKFYGYMDYFYVGNGHQNKGLINGFIKSKFKTGIRSSFLAHVHQFIAESRIVNGDNSRLSSALGTEADLVYALNLTPGVVLHTGYSHLFFTDSLASIKTIEHPKNSAAWGWAMISFKSALFTTKTGTTD